MEDVPERELPRVKDAEKAAVGVASAERDARVGETGVGSRQIGARLQE